MFLKPSVGVYVTFPQVRYTERKTLSTPLLQDGHLVKEAGITEASTQPTRFCSSLSLRLNRKIRLYMYVCACVCAWVSGMHIAQPFHWVIGTTSKIQLCYIALITSHLHIFLVKPNARKITWEGNKIRGEVWWFGEPESLFFHVRCIRDLTAISSLKYSGINYITEIWCGKWNP